MCKYYETGRCCVDYDSSLCFCGGDRLKCDFYPDIRYRAMFERTTELINDISDILKRMDKTIKNIGEALEVFKEVNE